MDTNQPSQYVKLVSSDKFEFVILREVAEISPTLASMLNTKFQFKESKMNKITLNEIDGALLDKVVDYLYYNKKYNSIGHDDNDENRDDANVPEFEIPTEMALELLVAADFLNI